MEIKLIILTQWKRNHLENQLNCISKQDIKIDYIIVFQNEIMLIYKYIKKIR